MWRTDSRLDGSNRLPRPWPFGLEGAAQNVSRRQQAAATAPSTVGGALGARLVHKRSHETTTRLFCWSRCGGRGINRRRRHPIAGPSLLDLDKSREVGSTRMEGGDALPVRRRVARMAKARRGRDAPGFDSDRQPGRRSAVRRTEAARRGKRFGPPRGNVAMRQIQA